jgi:peroxiredoxin
VRGACGLAAAVACAVLAGGSGCDTAKPSKGDLAPDFVLQSIDGRTRKLSNYRGKVVLVNLWATWCPPCLEELPVLDQLGEEFGDKGLVVLGVAGDEDVQAVRDFLAKSPVKFEVLLDPRGVIGTQYAITGYPETFFVDREGRLRDKIVGPVPHEGRVPGEKLSARIRELLGGGG